ncbi:putative RNA-binding protein YlxR (DUF448 family) [Lachnospiraceae bacterium PF1-21]|uniref:YlxR family protein n=1 Tax=Ohessyouella blattaphilus TaxID=2949333 RepID=A0ABT1EEE7_9FIRM|nr:YlxR family protein [Ohessyouella blattaphilus]MCP1109073.1 YlxR family protein [Ohessyouella blattaphilus]MCR8562467.1 YlxR family protein [Ohessyouella blattaphilus]MDL2250641.1 YlxR family protein [Lachnospiraceae bacterium OttesenSCG-928-J05]
MSKKIPMRLCVGCKELKPKKELIRVVKNEELGYALDATGKKNGRGAYLCANSDCLNQAIRSKGLERSFKAPIPEAVYEELKKEMENLGTK